MRKSKLVLLLSTASITLSVIFMAACHKSSNATTDTGFSTDQSTADKSFEDAQTASDQAAGTPTGSMNFRTTATTAGPCAQVSHYVDSIASDTYYRDSVIAINFGTTDCTCLDGSVRRGEIIVYYTGPYRDSGTKIYITFNNFYQNDNKVTGLKTVQNMGTNSSGQTYFNVTVNGSVTLATGGTITASWNRVRTWVTQGTPNVYQITGTGTITRANGTVVTAIIPTTTPLVFYSNCRWIEAGTINYTLPSGLTASMNYGNTANCDDQAILTYNGRTYNITLR